MTEFFHHLVSRSHASSGEMPAGEILRPRLPSLFEALPAGSESVQAAPVETDYSAQGDGSPQSDYATVERRDPLPLKVTARLPRERGPARNNDRHVGEEILSGLEARQFQAVINNEGADQQLGNEDLLRAREPRTAAVRPENARPLPAQIIGEQEKAADSGEQAEGPGERHVPIPRLEPYPPVPLLAPADPFGTPEHRPSVPVTMDPVEANLRTPTVHISIGRIEVRAVTSPARPSTQTPSIPRPKLSLDEYLRQRNEGKR